MASTACPADCKEVISVPPRLMANRQQLRDLARIKLTEAGALYDAGLFDGCVYLCGYVVELALKARVCATLGVSEYPERGSRLKDGFRTHDFDDLSFWLEWRRSFWEIGRNCSATGLSPPNGNLNRVTSHREVTMRYEPKRYSTRYGTSPMEFSNVYLHVGRRR